MAGVRGWGWVCYTLDWVARGPSLEAYLIQGLNEGAGGYTGNLLGWGKQAQ